MSQPAQFKNLPDLLLQSTRRFDTRPLFGTRSVDGEWTYTTYGEFGELVTKMRGGLAGLGLAKGERVAFISNNRLEWAVSAYATYSLGGCVVPMYEKQNEEDWAYILKDSQAKILLVANDEILAKAEGLKTKIETLEHIVNFEGRSVEPLSYRALLEKGAESPVPSADPDPGELCGFIYTSGTTGNPKGVMLSHGNITSNVNAMQEIFPLAIDDRSLSFLPWAHSFGQTVELHMGISYGMSMALCDEVDKLLVYLAEVKPTLLISVPRIFNRVYDSLNKKMADASPIQQRLFAAAMATANERRELSARGESSTLVDLKHGLFDKLIFTKVRDRLGGNLRYAISGGAAISKEVAQFIDNVGVTVYEGYGLSETSPIATANYPGNQRIGSVGRAIPGVEIIIDADATKGAPEAGGEVLIKGPNVMRGYHNMTEETAAVIRDDGAFRSGDMGKLDDDGYLFITGRIKEQYKLENGKYVVPSPLEEQLKLSGFINQALVYGDNRQFNVALIVPDAEALAKFAEDKGVAGNLDAWLTNAVVHGLFRGEIETLQSSVFKGYERIGEFRLIPEEFTTDNDMLTPTLKLKRRNVISRYGSILDEMYAGS
ncbi:MAG: long-chain fatty acid--CoA ligase [Gemmatimonadetes bacterium]|nr:long-chain fatty acid--CoA ligase [Gemmatimonadota bacterium]